MRECDVVMTGCRMADVHLLQIVLLTWGSMAAIWLCHKARTDPQNTIRRGWRVSITLWRQLAANVGYRWYEWRTKPTYQEAQRIVDRLGRL